MILIATIFRLVVPITQRLFRLKRKDPSCNSSGSTKQCLQWSKGVVEEIPIKVHELNQESHCETTDGFITGPDSIKVNNRKELETRGEKNHQPHGVNSSFIHFLDLLCFFIEGNCHYHH